MAKNTISYKKAITTTLKVSGILNSDEQTIDADGEEIKIDDLLKEFGDEFVELQLKLKDDEELVLEQDSE